MMLGIAAVDERGRAAGSRRPAATAATPRPGWRRWPPRCVALAAAASERSRTATCLALVVFGLGFGLVSQVLMVAVQNAVDRRVLGTATAVATFFRALGGAVGAAVLGAVFAAQAGTSVGGHVVGHVDPALAAAVTDAAQRVFLVAAPIALAGALVVLRLPGAALRTEAPARA